MDSPWSSTREVTPSTSRLLIERAHEELVGGNASDPRLRDVRTLVRDSWSRSLEHLVRPEGLPPLDFSPEELEAYRSAHPLAGVMDMIRALLAPEANSGVVVAVGDASGRLLWVEGDRQIRRLTSDMGFVEGANWSETAVGTSAPGTALTLGRSVQIHGAEHFNRHVQPWSCTAAPVRDPDTRRVVGVIDVTGGADVVTPQAALLVDATVRAIEGEMLVAKLRTAQAPTRRTRAVPEMPQGTTLRVLGRDRALLEVTGDAHSRLTELTARHAEILLMLALHPHGLSADRLGELVYGPNSVDTLRPELVRLRRVLEKSAPHLIPQSRPYRLPVEVETDAQQVLSLLDRGAHRVALAAYSGAVLPDSVSPGVERFRDTVRTTLREAILTEASLDVLLTFADTEDGADDIEALRLALSMLPARSPKRAGLVARIERLETDD